MSRTLDRSQGKFEAMPVSDGAPIVESGSNADGEWTRWADGTQICTGNVDGGGSRTGSRTYPIGFLGLPYNTGGANGNANSVCDFWGIFNTATNLAFTYRWTTRSDMVGYYLVAGRWK